MTLVRNTFAIVLAAVLGPAYLTQAATITSISSPLGFLAGTTVSDDFEAGAHNDPPSSASPFGFEGSSKLGSAEKWTAGVTSSGKLGLVEFFPDLPLRIEFDEPVNEVGMFFGNDDFGRIFNANLELFDANNVSLGKVQVRSNGNDQADQYIGARSSVPARSALIYYDQPNAQLLSVYIDDLKVGALVPEPTCAVLAMFVVALVAATRCGRR